MNAVALERILERERQAFVAARRRGAPRSSETGGE
jgi:hypothetical protein